MKKTFIMLVSALAFLSVMASCEKSNEPEQEPEPTPLTVTASVDAGDLNIAWKEGDVIWGFYQSAGQDVVIKYKVTSANGNQASFAKDDSWGTFAEPATGTVVYMAYTNEPSKPSGSSVEINFAEQDGTRESALKNAKVMVATGSVTGSKLDLKFSGCMSVVAVSPVTLPHGAVAQKIEIVGAGVPESGAIKVDNGKMVFAPAASGDAASITANCQADGATYIAVPAVNLSGVTVNAIADGNVYPVIENVSQNLTANAVIEWDTNPVTIKAFFSVSETDKVIFAKGNLYYDGTTWKFEKNQYDFRGVNGSTGDIAVIDGEQTTTPENNFGMMFWSNLGNYGAGAYVKIDPATTEDSVNWGTATLEIADAGGREWYTMSTAEAVYLFNERTDAAKLRAKATITTSKGLAVKGLLVFPDGYDAVPADLETEDVANSYYDQKTFTYDEWTYMEEEGVVFLPATGIISSKNARTNVGAATGYWNSSADTGKATFASMISIEETEKRMNFNPKIGTQRNTAHSIRLVSKCE